MASLASNSVLILAVLAVLVAGAYCQPTAASFSLVPGSTPTNIAVNCKYNGPDDFAEVQVRAMSSRQLWIEMTNAGGSIWKAKPSTPVKGPCGIRFETKKGLRGVVDNVITL